MSLNAQHVEPLNRWGTAAEDRGWCHVCYTGQNSILRLPKWGNIRLGLEFDINNFKAWIHPPLLQQFRLLLV